MIKDFEKPIKYALISCLTLLMFLLILDPIKDILYEFSVASLVAIISAFFAFIGLILNYRALKDNNLTRQIQLLNNSFNGILNIESTLYKDYVGKNEDIKKQWDSLLFNSIEQFAFLVNERFIKNKKISAFFDDAIVHWYDNIYIEHYNKKEINNLQNYPEFKKLYHKIKLEKYKK